MVDYDCGLSIYDVCLSVMLHSVFVYVSCVCTGHV